MYFPLMEKILDFAALLLGFDKGMHFMQSPKEW
jgi:hypothetical protein